MYHEFYGLKQAPFKITPDTRLFFPGGRRGEILEALVYAIGSGEGIVKVVGEVGSGKTMLCRMLEVRLSEQVEIVYLPNPSLTPEDILHAIALELGIEVVPSANRIHVMQALHRHLLERHATNKRIVVFVEEAQAMPLETLEEIRLLSNLETQRDKLLQIVLFGQPELDRNLNRKEIRQLRERITHSFNLPPLTGADIRQYVQFRLQAVGYRGPDMFDARAYKAIAHASKGLTRRINILADKCLLAAFAENTHNVTFRHARQAIRDSELHRANANMKQPLAIAAGVVFVIAAGLIAFQSGFTVRGQVMNLVGYFTGEPTSENGFDSKTGGVAEGIANVESPAQKQVAVSDQASVGASEQIPVQNASEVIVAAADAGLVGEAVAQRSDGASVESFVEAASEESYLVSVKTESSMSGSLHAAETETKPEATQSEGLVVVSVQAAAEIADAQSSTRLQPESNTVLVASTQSESPGEHLASVESVNVPIETVPPQSATSALGAPIPKPKGIDDAMGLLGERLVAAQTWLRQTDPQHYTIQILATHVRDVSGLLELLNRWKRAGRLEKVYIYRTKVGETQWFGVLYDDFESFSEARAALDRLPSDVRHSKPFVRNVRDISELG